MNSYGWNIAEQKDSIPRCTELLSNYLNKGRLALVLGAGASFALGLPGWEELVRDCISDLPAGKVTIDPFGTFDPKLYSHKFKKACSNQSEYIRILRKNLYKKVTFDFTQANKELLIALMSLLVGRSRGNVRNIITYNFDNIIEWYLTINGLRVNVLDKRPLEQKDPDVEILHLHGFLPPEESSWRSTDEIVFTQEEFNVRERGNAYWKRIVDEIYKNYIFLSIGLSAESICKDVIPYLQVLNGEWYSSNHRGHPYGISFLTKYDKDQGDEMLDNGIIPCKIDKDLIPSNIFRIAQSALAKL